MGSGQYSALDGNDYRQTANENMVVVIMIETPIGVDNAERIASVPGVDVVFAASVGSRNFLETQTERSRMRSPGECIHPVKCINDVTLKHGVRREAHRCGKIGLASRSSKALAKRG